jgi:hypothetical protein
MFKSLKENLPKFFYQAFPPGEVPTKIQRYFNRCWKFIEAYSIDAYNSVARK